MRIYSIEIWRISKSYYLEEISEAAYNYWLGKEKQLLRYVCNAGTYPEEIEHLEQIPEEARIKPQTQDSKDNWQVYDFNAEASGWEAPLDGTSLLFGSYDDRERIVKITEILEAKEERLIFNGTLTELQHRGATVVHDVPVVQRIEKPEKYYMLNVQCEVAPLCGNFELEEEFDLAQLTIKCGIDPIMGISLLRIPSTFTYKTNTGEERAGAMVDFSVVDSDGFFTPRLSKGYTTFITPSE